MTNYYQDDMVTLHHGDCLDVLASMPDNSIDSIVTDPPYGLSNTTPEQVAETITRWVSGDREYMPTGRGFMGKEWDSFVPPVAVWDECLRVLKPGGHVVAFAGSRTHDFMTLSIRLAGFEIRDSLAWLYGSGFPKSLDVSKAIDKASGAEREVVGQRSNHRDRPITDAWKRSLTPDPTSSQVVEGLVVDITAPATPEAEQWAGWGTALKPAFEPIVLARKPLDGTVANNVLAHGVGGLNIDACRVGSGTGEPKPEYVANDKNQVYGAGMRGGAWANTSGRFPANVLLDEHAATWVDEQSGASKSSIGKPRGAASGDGWGMTATGAEYADKGGASRFFPVFKYQAKAPKRERPVIEREDGTKIQHPTVKPLALMEWLVRLITPPGGTVLDPFAGSGTTIEAAILEGFTPVGIERETDYLPLITARITRAKTFVQEVLDLGSVS